VLRTGTEKEVEQSLARILNAVFDLGRTAFFKMLLLTEGSQFRAEC
jgi:hypothetical protein